MREIQATEAKARLAELLRVVERGESVVITRHGRPVAHLVPAPSQDRANRERAIERFRQRRAGWKRVEFSTAEILAARHEGHRLLSGLVVDASVVIAWLFDDEKEPRADKVLEYLAEKGALAPHLWRQGRARLVALRPQAALHRGHPHGAIMGPDLRL